MDSFLSILNNTSSVALSIACWWLAHTYSANAYPHGRPIAALFGAIGMVTLVITFARNIGADPTWFTVVFKLLLILVCALLARRTQLNAKARGQRGARAQAISS